MTRRKFGTALSAAVAGIGAALAASSVLGQDKADKHVCRGMNECKGQGGCKSGDNGCAGKNSCKGKGGCSVPLKARKSLRLRGRRQRTYLA